MIDECSYDVYIQIKSEKLNVRFVYNAMTALGNIYMDLRMIQRCK
jgi:hypothetical protein